MDMRLSVQKALQTRSGASLRVLQKELGVNVSHATLGRIRDGQPVSQIMLRRVGKALGIVEEQRESWQRRARLRAECAERGLTLEDAAEMFLQQEEKTNA